MSKPVYLYLAAVMALGILGLPWAADAHRPTRALRERACLMAIVILTYGAFLVAPLLQP